MFAQFRPQNRFAHQVADGIQPGFDLRRFQRRPQQTLSQQTPAHPGGRLVQNADQRGAAVREDRLHQFQIPNRHGVQHHGVGAVKMPWRIQMVQRRPLRVAQVVQHSPAGRDGAELARQAEPVERQQLEMLPENTVRIIRGEDPVFQFRNDPLPLLGLGKQRRFGGYQQFPRAHALEQPRQFRGVYFRSPELTGGDIHVREPGPRAVAHHGGQVVVLVRAQQVGIRRGARRDDARDFAAHQFLARARLFHLLADGDAIPAPDQFRDVILGGVIRHAAHRNGRAFFFVPGGQGDLEFARGRHGVFEEKLVEISQPEHQQRARHLLFHSVVLAHQRRGRRFAGLTHEYPGSLRFETRETSIVHRAALCIPPAVRTHPIN